MNTELVDRKQINIPYSGQNMFVYSNKNNENLCNYSDSNIALRENSDNNSIYQRENSNNKLFSNQNLYYTNNNLIINNNDDLIFEKPFNVNNNFAGNRLINDNHIKFSNKEIPEVFDETYIQRRINKAEINSPSDDFILNSKLQNSNFIQKINNQSRGISSQQGNSIKKFSIELIFLLKF